MRHTLILSLALITACSQEGSFEGDYERYAGPQPAIRITAAYGVSTTVFALSVDGTFKDPYISAMCPEGNISCEAGELIDLGDSISLEPSEESWSLTFHYEGAPFGIAFDPTVTTITSVWGRDHTLSDEDCGREVGIMPSSYDFADEIKNWGCIVLE